MNLIYEGPEGQVNHEVGLALAARAEPAEIELQGVTRDVVGTDDPGASARLEPGAVYDLPRELAERLLASSPFWRAVTNYGAMTKEQLETIAAEHDIEGRTSMTKAQLVAAIRKTSAPAPAAPTTASPIGPDPGGVPREDTGAPLEPVTTTDEGGDEQ